MPLSNFGKDGDHIQLSPPFVISEAEVAQVVAALDDALTEVTKTARRALTAG